MAAALAYVLVFVEILHEITPIRGKEYFSEFHTEDGNMMRMEGDDFLLLCQILYSKEFYFLRNFLRNFDFHTWSKGRSCIFIKMR